MNTIFKYNIVWNTLHDVSKELLTILYNHIILMEDENLTCDNVVDLFNEQLKDFIEQIIVIIKFIDIFDR